MTDEELPDPECPCVLASARLLVEDLIPVLDTLFCICNRKVAFVAEGFTVRRSHSILLRLSWLYMFLASKDIDTKTGKGTEAEDHERYYPDEEEGQLQYIDISSHASSHEKSVVSVLNASTDELEKMV